MAAEKEYIEVKIAKIDTEMSHQTAMLQDIYNKIDVLPSRGEFSDHDRRIGNSEDHINRIYILMIGGLGSGLVAVISAIAITIAAILGVIPQIHFGGH